MKDWRGSEIEVGSTVVYPTRSGSLMWMQEGVVQSLGDSEVIVKPSGNSLGENWPLDGRIRTVTLTRLTVIP